MLLPPQARTLAGRLASFEGEVQLAKRRASTSNRKKTPSAVSWPHKFLNPEDLAQTGFYYRPTQDEVDNVTCFLCQKSLAGWEPGDVAALEHVTHSPDCGWAVYSAISLRRDDADLVEEDAGNEKMAEARLATFQNMWPHENKKGWKCTTKALVDAGWCYDPSPEYDDGTTCFYCHLSVDAWEPKDDPWLEHHKRSPNCHFFVLTGNSPPKKKRAGRKGRPTSKASKVSRLSTLSSITAFTEPPSQMSLGEDEPLPEASMLSKVSTATSAIINTSVTATKGRKAGGAKSKLKPRKARTSTTSTVEPSAVEPSIREHTEELTVDVSELPSDHPPKRRVGRPKKIGVINNEASELTSLSNETVPKSSKRKRQVKKSAKPEKRLSEGESQLHSELIAAAEAFEQSNESKTLAGTKRMSDGSCKPEASIIPLEHVPPAENNRKPAKSARLRSKTIQESSSLIEDVSLSQAEMPGLKGKKRGRKPRQQPVEVHRSPSTSLADFPLPPVGMDEYKKPLPGDDSGSKVPAAWKETVRRSSPLATRGNAPLSAMTPSPSPQSSDAENKPPSSRPSTIKPNMAQDRKLAGSELFTSSFAVSKTASAGALMPPAISTPRKPLFERKNEGQITSSHPWKSVDLEAIFLQTPSRREGDRGKFQVDGGHAAGVAEPARRPLTSPEEKMTVEEWIMSNAARGEQRLREECERLVSIFETEGGKALRALEGIQCI